MAAGTFFIFIQAAEKKEEILKRNNVAQVLHYVSHLQNCGE
jgi:hypothetical protein